MKNNNEIKTLPSKVILSNGNILTFDELKENDKKKIQDCICKNISSQLSNYYSLRKEEWENFISIMN